MGQYLNDLYTQNYSLQCENKALRRTIDEFKNGRRYKILKDGYDRVIAGYKKESRRHCSFEAFDPEEDTFASEDGMEELVISNEMTAAFVS